MKKIILPVIALLFINSLNAQQQQDTLNSMQDWQVYMTPGKMQNRMENLEGKWKTKMTIWTDSSQQKTTTAGICENKMMLGNRYLQSHYIGSFMNKSFEGYGILAYDNGKNIFYSNWIDNMGTGMLNLNGNWNDSASTIVLTGTSYDPSMKMDINTKELLKFDDDNHYTMEMYYNLNGRYVKSMEINYTRSTN